MGGTPSSTVQQNPLASLFGGSQGYQQPAQPQQMAPAPPAIQQPGYGMPAMTPQQAALATQARMQVRSPMDAPAGASTKAWGIGLNKPPPGWSQGGNFGSGGGSNR